MKIGDEIKIIANKSSYSFDKIIGMTGIVLNPNYDSEYPIQALFDKKEVIKRKIEHLFDKQLDGFTNIFYRTEVELIEPKTADEYNKRYFKL